MIEYIINGYLAKPFDSEELARGIDWVLNAPNYYELSLNARAKVLMEFDSRLVAKRYIELYKSILENKID
ncbi:MAG: glycosyl transferase family 1, partial [Candidatus Calescibacterium sp.]|nr:glycosyl transferase family 1 [Candidatus Calescibacterium sp.]